MNDPGRKLFSGSLEDSCKLNKARLVNFIYEAFYLRIAQTKVQHQNI